MRGATALTDGVDAPAETEAALAIAVLVSVIVIERRTVARSLRVPTKANTLSISVPFAGAETAARDPAAPPPATVV